MLMTGEYNYAIAFQERIKVSDEKLKFYEELAEMYVGKCLVLDRQIYSQISRYIMIASTN